MELRALTDTDAAQTAALFRASIFELCALDYSPEQLAAWSAAADDIVSWNKSFEGHLALAAVCGSVLAGFADADVGVGYLDRLYVSPQFTHQGIASMLCSAVEAACGGVIYTHASITARSFFVRRGYTVVRENQVMRRGVALTNYIMELRRP